MEFLQKNARAIIIALLIVGVVVAISTSGSDEPETKDDAQTSETASTEQTTEDSPESEPESEPESADTTEVVEEVQKNENVYSVSAVAGDNQTKLVRRVIEQYVDEADVELSAEQRLFVETNLVNTLPRNDLIFVGDTIKVDEAGLKSFVDASKNLTQAEIAIWATYL